MQSHVSNLKGANTRSPIKASNKSHYIWNRNSFSIITDAKISCHCHKQKQPKLSDGIFLDWNPWRYKSREVFLKTMWWSLFWSLHIHRSIISSPEAPHGTTHQRCTNDATRHHHHARPDALAMLMRSFFQMSHAKKKNLYTFQYTDCLIGIRDNKILAYCNPYVPG